MVKAGVSYCTGPNKDVWYNRVVDRIKRRETQVLHTASLLLHDRTPTAQKRAENLPKTRSLLLKFVGETFVCTFVVYFQATSW